MGGAGRYRLEECANDRIGIAPEQSSRTWVLQASKQILKNWQHENGPRGPELGEAPAEWPGETR